MTHLELADLNDRTIIADGNSLIRGGSPSTNGTGRQGRPETSTNTEVYTTDEKMGKDARDNDPETKDLIAGDPTEDMNLNGRGNRTEGDNLIDVGGSVIPNDLFDVDKTIDELNKSMLDAYNALLRGDVSSQGQSIISTLSKWQDFLRQHSGLNEANSMQVAQSVFNTIFALVDQSLTANNNLRNWLIQQDYNTPANAIQRLMEAGVNPAYYFGCMGQSNAGEIGSTQQAQTQTAALGDNTTNAQRKLNTAMDVLGGVSGAVGSLVQGGFGGATQGVKNLADATSALGNLQIQQNLQPAQMAQLMSQSASNWANAVLAKSQADYTPDFMKAQQYELKERAKNYSASVDMKQKELDNLLKIAQWNNDTLKYNTDKSTLATIMSANIGKYATMYAADKSHDASVFGSRMGLAASVLPHVYTRQRQHVLYSKKTGEKLNLSSEQQAKLNWQIWKGELDFQEGKEFTFGDETVVGYDFDTDVLDVVRLGGMNEYFNNFVETGNVFGNQPLNRPKMANDLSDYFEMVDYVTPYVRKAASGKIAGRMMDDAKKNARVDSTQSFQFQGVNDYLDH